MKSPLDFYHFYEVIGTGATSTVYHAENLVTKDSVAVKVLPKIHFQTDEQIASLKKELEITKLADHPHVIHFYDAFEDNGYIYFVLENAENGTLEACSHGAPYAEKNARRIFEQIVSAVDYLHNSIHVIHRDLKLDNIVFDKYNNIRIADFGLSSKFDLCVSEFTDVVGSPLYAAPEMVQRLPYTIKLDIWCLGIILFTMMAGHYPFIASTSNDLAKKIVNSKQAYPSTFSSSLCSLLDHMLDKNPETRYSIDQIQKHSWLHYKQPNFSSLHMLISGKTDPLIIKEMGKFGYKCSDIESDLESLHVSRECAVYRILRTKKIAKITTNIEKTTQLTMNFSAPSPSLLDSYSPESFHEEEEQESSPKPIHPVLPFPVNMNDSKFPVVVDV